MNLAVLELIMAPVVFKNGRPRIMGDLSLVPVLTTMKSVGMYELPTRTARYKHMVVYDKGQLNSFSYITLGMMLTLAPKS